MPVHTYSNWNSRSADFREQIEPFRKYFFICEGANTETFYFKRLIDLRKQLGIHPLIDICLWEKTDEDRNMSFVKNLFNFAKEQKENPENGFDIERDKMVIVFDGDIFEEKVKGYEDLLKDIEENDIAAVTNPGFELFLILHVAGSYKKFVEGRDSDYLRMDDKGKYSYAYKVLLEITGINAKRNPDIGNLANNVRIAIAQEKKLNQNIHDIKGKISSNIGKIIEEIIKENPNI